MGEYDGDAPAGEVYGDSGGPGEPGEPGCGDHALLYAGERPEASEAPDGENDGPGVMLLPTAKL